MQIDNDDKNQVGQSNLFSCPTNSILMQYVIHSIALLSTNFQGNLSNADTMSLLFQFETRNSGVSHHEPEITDLRSFEAEVIIWKLVHRVNCGSTVLTIIVATNLP